MDGRFPKNVGPKCTRSSLFTREHITSFEVIQIIVELLEFDRTLMVVCCAVWIYPAALSITACCREVFSRADDMDDVDSTDACIMTGGEVCCCEHAENSTSLRKHLEYTSTWSVTFHAWGLNDVSHGLERNCIDWNGLQTAFARDREGQPSSRTGLTLQRELLLTDS